MAFNYYSQTPQTQYSNQPIFPQPSGNVYSINNSLEVANVPTGAGISIALCMPENLMYIKTVQNGSPMFWSYKITPYDNNKEEPAPEQSNQLENRINSIEEKLNNLLKDLGGKSK